MEGKVKPMAAQAKSLSIITGPKLSDETGFGTLTLPGFLREVTEKFGPREALVLYEGGRVIRWSYDDLYARAMDVARALRACGIGKDARVGVLMTNRPEWLSATFGITMAGGVAVTISTFSTPSELEYLLQISSVSVLLVERSVLKKDFVSALVDLEPQIRSAVPGKLHSLKFPFLRRIAVVGEAPEGGALESWEAFVAHGADEPRELIEAIALSVKPSDAGALFFSSGSTSKPKAILNAHRGAAIQLWRWPSMYGVDENVRTWAANGFFFSGNFGMAVGATLGAGGALILQQTFNAEEALELMQKEKVSMPIAWPHQWAQLEAAPNWLSVDLSAMRYVDHKFAIARHPTVSAPFYAEPSAYGNTETFTLSAAFPADVSLEERAGAAGRPLVGMTFKIIDPMSGEIVARGERGEICVKGATLMLGYIGTPLEETLDEEGFFRTGDGGYVDAEGRLYWEGRLTDIIKTGGANVSPLEVDEVIAKIAGVKLATTVGVPHDLLGEVVVTCVVPHEGATLDAADIRKQALEKLASYKAPRHVLFFTEEEVSLTGSAKIKASDLKQLAAARLQDA